MADATSGNISKIKLPNGSLYNIDSVTVNGHTVNSDVPANAKFTDTNTQRSNSDIINLIYPVGSIYMSMSATNPSQILGVGTWKAVNAYLSLKSGSSSSSGNVSKGTYQLLLSTDSSKSSGSYASCYMWERTA